MVSTITGSGDSSPLLVDTGCIPNNLPHSYWVRRVTSYHGVGRVPVNSYAGLRCYIRYDRSGVNYVYL